MTKSRRKEAATPIEFYLKMDGVYSILWNNDKKTLRWEHVHHDLIESLIKNGYQESLFQLDGCDNFFKTWIASSTPPKESILMAIVQEKGSAWLKNIDSISTILSSVLKYHDNGWNEHIAFFRDIYQIVKHGDAFYTYAMCEEPKVLAEKLISIAKGNTAAPMLDFLHHPWTAKFPQHAQAYKEEILKQLAIHDLDKSSLQQGLLSCIGRNIPFPEDEDIRNALIEWYDQQAPVKEISRIAKFQNFNTPENRIEYSFLRNQAFNISFEKNMAWIRDERVLLGNDPAWRKTIWRFIEQPNPKVPHMARDIVGWLFHPSTSTYNWGDNDWIYLQKIATRHDVLEAVKEKLDQYHDLGHVDTTIMDMMCLNPPYVHSILKDAIFTFDEQSAKNALRVHADVFHNRKIIMPDNMPGLSYVDMLVITFTKVLYPNADLHDIRQCHVNIKSAYNSLMTNFDEKVAAQIVADTFAKVFGNHHAEHTLDASCLIT